MTQKMSDDSDSDTRPSLDEEREEMSPDEDEELPGERESPEEGSALEGGEDDDEEDEDSPKLSSKPKQALDVTTVALERTIFVGNLPSKLDHRDVVKLFKPCGPVESARIRSVVPEKEKLSPKVALITKRMHPKIDSVNAYVVFAKTDNDDCLKKALAMNGKVIDEHRIRVDRAQKPNSRRLTLTSRKKSVFVGNLRFDLRDDDLINHFQKVGDIDYVRLVRDRATGLGKGFGFVKFMERAAVKKALELNDTDFKGRKLRVKKVDEKMKMDDNDKKPHQRPKRNNSSDDGQSNKQVREERPSGGESGGFNQRMKFDQSKQNSFRDRKPRHKKSDGNSNQNNRRRVKFDLKNNESSNNQQKREAPKFSKVKITKRDQVKKKTILKKRLKKGMAKS